MKTENRATTEKEILSVRRWRQYCLLVGLLMLLVIRVQANSELRFSPATSLPVGAYPKEFVAEDFNRDGRLDIALVNANSDMLTVLLGNGNGTFRAPMKIALESFGTLSIVTGDLDADGNLDLIVSDVGMNSVAVLRGNGTGGFGPREDFLINHAPAAMITGDFNRDGRLDIATGNLNSNSVSVLYGNGQGGFLFRRDFVAGDDPRELLAGDFNCDGKLDLVVSNFNGHDISFLPGGEAGVFGTAQHFAAGSDPRGIAAGDFNGDHRLDLVVADNGSNRVLMLLGKGAGGFSAPVEIAAGLNPLKVVASDFNVDEHADLVVAFAGENAVGFFLGNGAGNFAAAGHANVGLQPMSFVVADFTRDRLPDVMTANWLGEDLSLLVNKTEISVLQAICHLRQHVEQLGLPHGLENALTTKLKNALRSLEKEHPNAAIMQLRAFILQVEAQNGKKIPPGEAAYLRDAALTGGRFLRREEIHSVGFVRIDEKLQGADQHVSPNRTVSNALSDRKSPAAVSQGAPQEFSLDGGGNGVSKECAITANRAGRKRGKNANGRAGTTL